MVSAVRCQVILIAFADYAKPHARYFCLESIWTSLKLKKMKTSAIFSRVALGTALVMTSVYSYAGTSFSDGFETGAPGWLTVNLSDNHISGNEWSITQGISDGTTDVVLPHSGDWIASADFTSIGRDSGTISNWFISPVITQLHNGDKFSFYTTTAPGSDFPDRMEVRLSTSGSSTNVGGDTTSVGDFTKVLTTINPTLAVGGYPENWTLVTLTVSGLSSVVDGRLAFRYFVTDGGPTGNNSSAIGVDDFRYTAVSPVPEAESIAMLLAGLGVLAGVQRRRQRKQKSA